MVPNGSLIGSKNKMIGYPLGSSKFPGSIVWFCTYSMNTTTEINKTTTTSDVALPRGGLIEPAGDNGQAERGLRGVGAPDSATEGHSSGIETNWSEAVETFDDLELREDLLRGIYAYGFEQPSQIQKLGILPVLRGHDTIAQAQVGACMQRLSGSLIAGASSI